MKTCKRGHPRTSENLDKKGTCKACKADWQRAHYQERKDSLNARKRERYASDPEYAKKLREQSRESKRRMYADPEWRQKHLENFRRRYWTDPQFRAAVARRARERQDRINSDPIRLDERREVQRFTAYRRRREQGVPERNWRPGGRRDRMLGLGGDNWVPVEPFREWLSEWARTHSAETIAQLAERAGSEARTARHILSGDHDMVRIALVDRYLLAADEPYMLLQLYPVEEAA